ncbi:MAG TPA: hypothetical protein DD670_07525 [Planctomycetaceae bacterium]|nr:hypothetical protein [Planctomycetaceae bacterium]
MRFKATIAALIMSAVSMGIIGYREYRNMWVRVGDYYAIWHVADMLQYHIHDQQGVTPKNWNDLKAAYSHGNSGFTFAELQARIDIDFDELAVGVDALTERGDHYDRGQVIFCRCRRHSAEAMEVEVNDHFWKSLSETRKKGNRSHPGTQ